MITVHKVNTEEELNQVFEIRRIVFVVGQNCPPELEWENEDVSTHFIAFDENKTPCGAARWRKTEKGYKLERFAVLEHFRGKGVGQALVKAVLDDVIPLLQDGDKIYLHAQIQAMGLYEKFGFVPQGPQFEEAGIQHFKMVKS